MRIGKKQVKGNLTGDLWIKAYDSVLAPKSVTALVAEANVINEDFVDISDWVDNDSNTGVSTQVTFDGKSCLKLDSGTGGGAQRARALGTLGKRTVLNWSHYQVAIAGPPSTDEFYSYLYNGAYGLFFKITSTGFYVVAGGVNVEVGTDLVVQDVWQEWTMDIDWTALTIDLYLNGVLQASDFAFGYADNVTPSGTFHINAYYRTGNIQSISYIDWFKISNDGYTSVTISGLDGNTDEEYRLLCRFKNDYNGSSNYFLRPNNDSGANYGRQGLYGISSSAGAYRNTGETSLFITACDSISSLAQSDTFVYAKSGYARTFITNEVQTISGTTITAVAEVGGVWNDTSSNITSLVLYANQTNGLGVGTSIELWKKVPKI